VVRAEDVLGDANCFTLGCSSIFVSGWHKDVQGDTGIQQELKALFQLENRTAGSRSGAAFLHDFLSNRLWALEGDDAGDSAGLLWSNPQRDDGGGCVPSEEEEEFLDAADDFERSYNFRWGPLSMSAAVLPLPGRFTWLPPAIEYPVAAAICSSLIPELG
jgi:hypothetical protein